MSSSLPCNIPVVLGYVAKIIFSETETFKPDLSSFSGGKPLPAPELRILDVGAGFGKWGFLIRDSFDVATFQNFTKDDWKLDITAIEPFPKYITPLQEHLYNRIIQKDLFACMDELEDYDLVILGDVIEHFEKEKGYEALDKLLGHTRHLIISTPNGFMPQGAWAGNDREIHRSGWTLEDFGKYNVVEHKIVEDNLLKDIFPEIPGTSQEMKKNIAILILWINNTS